MQPEEIKSIIDRVPYQFTKEDVPDPTIKLHVSYYMSPLICTPAVYYIIKWKTLPPDALLHDPAIKDSEGWTCAMYWIMWCKGDIPKRLQHDPTLQNIYGTTCEMYWIIHRNTDAPEYLRHDPTMRNDNGDTCAM